MEACTVLTKSLSERKCTTINVGMPWINPPDRSSYIAGSNIVQALSKFGARILRDLTRENWKRSHVQYMRLTRLDPSAYVTVKQSNANSSIATPSLVH